MKRSSFKTKYFSRGEIILWTLSTLSILVSFFLFDGSGYLSLISSLIGVTSLLLCAKGNPLGQVLMVIFAILYAVISFTFEYYGEMITYLGMSMPMAIVALVSWLRHPYNESRSQVEVASLKKGEPIFIALLTVAVSVAFYFILKLLGTSNLLPSTFSVTTSFAAAYLTFRRNPWYAVAYALNDVVLIVLWILASFEDISYLSVIVCFAVFLVNDIYGFICWMRMKKFQTGGKNN